MRLLPAKKRTSSKVAKTLRTFMLKYALLKFMRAWNFDSETDEENGLFWVSYISFHGSNKGNGCKKESFVARKYKFKKKIVMFS